MPQENYARELFELHTLGVHGGYTQRDVMEAARCLSGWVVHEGFSLRRARARGEVAFHHPWHDDGPKEVLGVKLPAGGGATDLDRLVDLVVAHPSTAQHIATKLVRWFIGVPDPSAVDAAAHAFRQHDGAIVPTVRAVLTHPALLSAPPRLKRPFRYVVSTLRALGAVTQARTPLIALLSRMGHAPHAHPTPDGFPIEPEPWQGSLLWRWQWARDLGVGGTSVPWSELDAQLGRDPVRWFTHLVGRRPQSSEIDPVARFVDGGGEPRAAVALMLSSPAFQVH